MKIKLLASIHSSSGPLDEGTVHDLPEPEALELCGLGRAVRVKSDAPAQPESASLAPGGETAAAKGPARQRAAAKL